MFTAKDGDRKLRFVVPRGLLDDELGADASQTKRKAWVKTHLPTILDIRLDEAAATAPFDRVRIEEIT